MPSKIELKFDTAALYAWQVSLMDALRQRGHLLRCTLLRADRGVHGSQMPSFFGLVRQLESSIFDRQTSLMAPVAAGEFSQSDFDGPSDIEFNLSGLAHEPNGESYSFLLNGDRDFCGGFAALLAEQSPTLTLVRDGEMVAQVLPAINRKGLFAESWQSVVEHIMMLVCGVVDGTYLPQACDVSGEDMSSQIGPLSLPIFFAKQFSIKGRDWLRRRTAHQDHWQVGYRKISGPGVLETHEWPKEEYVWLPDDGQRYYADPFVFARGDTTYLFVEEFRYADCKGILAVAELREDGTFSTPQPILIKDYHLSYPLVFEQDGEIYMMPETSENKTLEIYRAEHFPDKWVLDRVLMRDIEIADATTVDYDGSVYLFGNVREGFVQSWGALRIYKGASRLGPFEPVQNGPALIDVASARPAGHMSVVDGKIVRIVQDGRGGYGAALLIARVSELGPDGYAQQVEKLLLPKESWTHSGVHTLNRAEGFEVIDVRGWRKKTS